MVEELECRFVNVVLVDQDFFDVFAEVVANGANDKVRLLIDQLRAFAIGCGVVNGIPQLEQKVQVPLQFACTFVGASGAGNDAHALGVDQLVHGGLELCAVGAINAARHTASARIVGHEHHVAPRKAHKGGQCCALVAALFFFNLDNQFLAFANGILDTGLADGYAFGKVLAGDFFEGQKAVTLFAVVDEARFKGLFDARHDGAVDVAFALFAPFNFDFVVEQFLPFDDGQAALFRLRGIDQHPLHDAILFVLSMCDTRPCGLLAPGQHNETTNRNAYTP